MFYDFNFFLVVSEMLKNNVNTKIAFNKPFVVGRELFYIAQAVLSGHLAGNGNFGKLCQTFLESNLKIKKSFMTTSGTSSLEMAALLCNIKDGDEVILPSYTFTSTANAFFIHKATLKFIDIRSDTLNMNESLIEKAITEKTKIICPVHYAGVACEMDIIMKIAKKYNLIVIEDAAHAIFSSYKGKRLGSFGNMAALSFHETKNFISGEGGALIVNDDHFLEQAHIIWEKGTNRKLFFEGVVDKYTWIDVGSSFYPSELISAFLYAQFEEMKNIMSKRMKLWKFYNKNLNNLANKGYIKLPFIPEYCEHNAHMFYILLNTHIERNDLLKYFNAKEINAVFHYIPLHSSPVGIKLGYKPEDIPITEDISQRIIRLPFYYELTQFEQEKVIKTIYDFFNVQF